MKADLNYSPSDVFETLPHPSGTSRLTATGTALEKHQRDVMAARGLGLTKLYGLAHTETEQAPDVEALRTIHVEVDEAVAEAYGWTDLDLKHGFHKTRQGPRFTIEPSVQTEILDRLLELNHARYKEEQEAGLHAPDARKKAGTKRKPKAKTVPPDDDQLGFF